MTTGYPINNHSQTTEIFDLEHPEYSCSGIGDYYARIGNAAGGLLRGRFPLICGGNFQSNVRSTNCYVVGNSSIAARITEGRSFPAALVVNDGEALWLTGGTKYSSSTVYLNTTEYIYLDGAQPEAGPDMPLPLVGHCLVRLDRKSAMLIGGYQGDWGDYEHRTWLFDFDEQKWTPGPNMTHGKTNPACGLIRDSVTGESIVVVTTGWGDSESRHHLTNSTELWVPQSDRWIPGPDFPKLAVGASGVTSSKRRHFIVVGGQGQHYEELFDLYQLQCFRLQCEWKKMEQELNVARKDPVVMRIPDGMATCNAKKN